MKEGEDDGGTLALQMSEDLSNKNWADIMQEEQYIAPPMNDSPEREPSPISGPPYIIQVNCVGATDEEIFFLFGGEITVKWMNFVNGKGKVELHDENSVRRVLALNGETINEAALSIEILENRKSNDVRMAGGMSGSVQYQRNDDARHGHSYQRGAHESGECGRGGFNARLHERGFHHGGYGGRGSHMDGGYSRGRGGGGGFRGGRSYGNDGYSSRGNYRDVGSGYQHEAVGGSGKGYHYSHQKDHRDSLPAPVNRSRTESSSSYATTERGPSRFSCDAPLSPPQSSIETAQRKPSAKSIFGDAKPVDTSKKLCEVEERLTAERTRKENERKEKEAEEKKRMEEERRDKDEEKKKKEEEKRKIEEEKEKSIDKVPHHPIQILRRPKTADSTDGPSSTDREYGSEERGEHKKEELRKKHSFKKDEREKEERDGDREKSLPKTMRTFSNSGRIGTKSGPVEQEESMRGGRGRGRGSRGRGTGRGGYGSGRKNSVGAGIDPSMERGKSDEKKEKREDSKEEKTENRPFNVQSRLYSDADTVVPSPHSSQLPSSAPKSVPIKDIVTTSSCETSDVASKGDAEKNTKKKGEEKEEVNEEKKVDQGKTSTPRKKNKGKEKDKLSNKFASTNKFAALLED